MRQGEPVIEESRAVEDVHHLRLMALLHELVREKGNRGAASALGLDPRTVASCMKTGRLSWRVREALEQGLQSGAGSAAARQRERNDALKGRVGELEGKLRSGLDEVRAAVAGEVEALREEQAKAMRQGLIDHAPHFNSTNRYLASDELTDHLKALIELSASPLASVETDFAIDSTGLATTTYSRWFDHKWGKERSKQAWVKTHLMCGVKTNIVTAALATTHESADTKQLPHLLERTAATFSIDEVSADKAYASKRNLREIEAVGAIPYIPFKSYSTGSQGKRRYDSLWAKMWHFYSFNRDEFNAHYHKRSNVETTMAMIKTKFGASVKSKTGKAQVNEVLCKVLCHNICVLIQSFYELGIETDFAVPTAPEPKIVDLNQYRDRFGI